MSSWKYNIGDNFLVLNNEPEAVWSKTHDDEDDNFIMQAVDGEVHKLQQHIKEVEYSIYKLRQWQRALKKENQ